MHSSKKSGRLSSAGPEILDFGSHCSTTQFKMILYSFIPNFKLKYEDSENIKTDHEDTVVFSLHQIKQRIFFETPSSSVYNWHFEKRMGHWKQTLPFNSRRAINYCGELGKTIQISCLDFRNVPFMKQHLTFENVVSMTMN